MLLNRVRTTKEDILTALQSPGLKTVDDIVKVLGLSVEPSVKSQITTLLLALALENKVSQAETDGQPERWRLDITTTQVNVPDFEATGWSKLRSFSKQVLFPVLSSALPVKNEDEWFCRLRNNLKRSVLTNLLFVASWEETLAGYCACWASQTSWGNEGDIFLGAVSPAFQRQGVGSTLVKLAEQELLSRGVERTRVCVPVGNRGVEGFLAKLGYTSLCHHYSKKLD